MNRNLSTTKWNRVFTDVTLANNIKEVWLNRNEKPVYKLAKNIHHTCFPDGSRINYQFDCVC